MAPILRTRLKNIPGLQNLCHDKPTTSKKPVLKQKKITKVQRDAKLERKREAERLRRQKIREDPKAYENYCKKEQERYKQRKRDNKIKSIDQLTEREKRSRRKLQNSWQASSRIKKKLQNSALDGNNNEISDNNNNMNNKNISKQALVGKKRIKKKLRKCYRENDKLKKGNEQLKKKVGSLQKKMQRLSMTKLSTSTSPKSTVDRFLKGKRVDNDIRKKLIFNEVIVQQIRDAFKNSESNEFKQILSRVLTNKIVKKYRQLSRVRKDIIPSVASRIPQSQDPLKYIKKPKAGQIFIQSQIKNFFEDNSQIDPGKKSFVKLNGEKVAKRYMNCTIIDMHAKFSAQSTYKVSYSTFAKYRPRYCVEPQVTQRNTCACITHENFSLLVSALHRMKIIIENTSEKIIKSLVCDNRSEKCLSRSCDFCKHKEIKINLSNVDVSSQMYFMKWVLSSEERISEKTKKPIIVKITSKNKITHTIEEVIKLLNQEIIPFMAHGFRIFHQKLFTKTLLNNLSADELVVLIDFSENYSCKYGTEIQSVHFGASRTQCTLHTGMIYGQNFSQGFATLSQSLRHDPAAITAHLKQVLNYYLSLFSSIKKIHFISDGPTTQYRNRKMVYIITQYFPLCYPQIDFISYNFSEAGHGKSAADGIGGALKRSADDQVKYGNDISNFDQLVTALRVSTKKIHIDVVTLQQIETIDTLLPEKFRPFTGTIKMHQYTWNRENSGLILFNSLSCLDCQPGSICKHFSMGQINYCDNRPQLASPKVRQASKRLQKVPVVTSEIKKAKVISNITLRRSSRNKK